MTEPLDPTKWPKWKHHWSLPATIVATPETEAELAEGYRDVPYSEEEVVAFARSERDAEKKAHDRAVETMQRELEKPTEPARRRR